MAGASSPTCTPARAAILTGQKPWNHGSLGAVSVAAADVVARGGWRAQASLGRLTLHRYGKNGPFSSRTISLLSRACRGNLSSVFTVSARGEKEERGLFAQCQTSHLQGCLSPAALARRVVLKPSWRPSASGTARGKWYTQKRSAACTAGCSRLCWARVMRGRQRSSGCSAPAGGCAAPAAASASGHQAQCDPCLSAAAVLSCKHAIHPHSRHLTSLLVAHYG